MKGSLHTDELLGADAAINIAPTPEDKADICQNAIDLARAFGIRKPMTAHARWGGKKK